ncbi:MAG: hypothetical protein IKN63_04235 [Bacilli bacterium]|nr:hypothetical protein [Bacilli bacterium]
MEERIKEVLKDKLTNLNLSVYSVLLEKEDSNLFLRIALDGEKLDLDTIVEATKVIDPIVSSTVDNEKLIKDSYILEVYGRSKEDTDEKN